MVLGAKDTSTVVTGRCTGHPCRTLKNKFARELIAREKDGIDPEEFERLGAGSLRAAVKEGDIEKGSFMCGQIAGLVKKEEPAADIIKEIVSEAESLLRSVCQIRGIEL